MQVAVLALQGAFIEHEHALSDIGVESFEIREAGDLKRDFDGLVLPGGESTVQGKLSEGSRPFFFPEGAHRGRHARARNLRGTYPAR